ncbi:hypothetical protein, partial [Microvirga massiliensis]|uniref:hypothetical protein n=1 Tax=Microvirga massiliensis TaxID=1033741 RepID=UPI001AEC12FB
PARTPRIDDQTHSPDQFSMIRRLIGGIPCWINEFRELRQDYLKYCSCAEDPLNQKQLTFWCVIPELMNPDPTLTMY